MIYRQFFARALLSAAGFFLLFAFSSRALAFAPTNMGGPPDGQSGVPIFAWIDRQFDATLSGATLTVGPTGTVRLQANAGNVQGGAPGGDNLCASVNLIAPDHLVCEHSSPLTASTWHTLTFTTGVKTSTGVALAANYTFQFQTSSFVGGDEFIAPPMVVGSVPRAGNKLPINAKVRVYFDIGGRGSGTTMRTSGDGSVFSTTNVQLFAASNGRPANDTNLLACATPGSDPAHPTDCTMALSGSQLIITPGKKAPLGTVASTGGSALTASGQYVLIIKGSSGGPMGAGGVRNSDGMGLPEGDYYVPFSTTTSDGTGPDVKGTYPQNGTTGVDRAIYNISVGFTEAVEDGPINESNILLYKDANANGTYNDGAETQITNVIVDFYPDRDEAIVSPTIQLDASKAHFIVVTTNVKDAAGNAFDGDRTTGGNQTEVITFTTGTLTNGQATDNTKPTISFANANNFSVAATFSESVQVDATANATEESSDLPFVVNNIKNWTMESPLGSSVSLAGKDIFYEPSTLTATIFGLMLPPNQAFRVKVATSTGAVKIKDLAGNLVNTTGSGNLATGTVQNAMQEGMLGPGGGGGFDFFDRGMSPMRVFPRSALAGATSTYEVEFPAATAVPSGGKIILTFPTGFSFVADGGSSECQDALTTIDNSDLNGPSAGAVTIASIACSAPSRMVTVTTGGATTVAGDRVRFILQGIVNSTVPKDFSTSGYTVDIKTKNTTDSLLESMTSAPFFLTQPGSQSIQGAVFNDNGAGGATAGDKTKSGTEPGIASVRVCMGGMMGFSCQLTTSTGAYAFNQLSDGFYHLDIPPLTSGTFVGGPFFRDINLSGGQSRTGENFAFRSTNRVISVSLAGIPSSVNLDVFAFNPTNTASGGDIVREVLWADGPQDGTDSKSVPVNDGTWEVGVGPWMPKDPSMGPGGMPSFTFMPPRSQQVVVSGTGSYPVSFTLLAANRTVAGSVKDGAGNAIPNAFVLARPSERSDQIGGVGVAQSQSDGTFSLKMRNGVYMIDASIPGMPPSSPKEITVQDTTGASDGNATADVYSEGTLITNDGDSGSDNLILKIAKGDRSISGRVLDESSNPIAYARVDAQQVDGSGNPIGSFMGSPTDSSGNFTIYVKDGTWKLRGFAPGVGELPAVTVTVAGSSVTGQNLQATSAQLGTVTGSVLKGGAAVAGAFVNIYGQNGGNHTVSDTGGKYSVKVRAGTNYTIDGFVPGAGPLTPVTGVTVESGVTLTGQNLTMSAPGTVRVTVAGVTDAFVEARDSNGRGNGTNANPTSGVYDVIVPAGTYTVRANSQRYGLIGTQASVAVTAGQTTSVTFTAPSAYVVSGTVASSSATCKNGASVGFADTTNGRVTMTTTDSSGVFSITLPNGTYFVSAGKSGCVDNADPAEVTVVGAAVTSGADRTLTAANATITGRVTLSGTGVTVDTKVMGMTSGGKFVFDDVDTSLSGGPNNFELKVTAGTWTVRARGDGYQSAEQSVTVTDGGTTTANFALSALSGYTRQDPKSSTVTPSQGGLVRDTNIGSNFLVNIPGRALGDDTDSASVTTAKTSAIVMQTSTTQVIGNAGFEITPTDANGNAISTLSSSDAAGVTITIPYTDADVTTAGVDETELSLAIWSDEKGAWEPISTTVDTTNNTLTAVTTHFSTFAAVAGRGTSTTSSSTTASTTTSGRTSGGGGRRYAAGDTYFIKGKEVKIELAPQVVHAAAVKSVRKNLAVTLGGEEVVFRDVSATAWYASYVASVIQSGIASGYKDAEGNLTGEYRPGANVTYAEIAKMALNSARQAIPESGMARNRFARGDWSEPYIQLAEDLGTSVYTQTLDVRRPATRGAVIQTLVEILKITEPIAVAPAAFGGTGAVVTGSGTLAAGSGTVAGSGALLSGSGAVTEVPEEVVPAPAPEETSVMFRDVPGRHPYADAILLAAKLGIVSGDTNLQGEPKGTFRPNAPINRAEVAKIFTKLIELGYVK